MDEAPSAIELFVTVGRRAQKKWLQAEGTIGSDDEAVHDIRVALRHLRAQMRAFRNAIDTDAVEGLNVRLREVGRSIGPARDDVVILRTVDEAASRLSLDVAELRARLSLRAEDSMNSAIAFLRSREYRSAKSEIERLLANPVGGPQAARSGRDLILSGSRERWRKLRRLGQATPERPRDEELHALRISAKRARYTAEIAAVIIPPAERFASQMEGLQTAYGEQHDAAVASAVVGDDCPEISAYLRGQADAMAREWRIHWRLAKRRRWRVWMNSK